MRTAVTLPNGLTFGCVVSVPPEQTTAHVTSKRHIPPPDPIPPCLTPEQRAAHEKVNAALQRLRDAYNPTSPRNIQASEDNSNQPEPLSSSMAHQAVPVPTAFMVPRIPDGTTVVPAPSPVLRLTSGPATNLPPEVQAVYDAANQLTQFNSGTPNVTHDANGNLTSITDLTGTTNFTYDARNRVIARNGPGINETYTYDALGRRITKTTNGETKSYLHDGNDIVAEVKGGAVTATYLRGQNIDEPFVRQSASGNEYYHLDAQGSTMSLTDAGGMVRTSYSYDAYGNTSITGIASANPFQYTGRENDGEGLYYYRTRYYTPALHRFLAEDQLGLDGGDLNFYSYTFNNPVNYTDPSGEIIFAPLLIDCARSLAVDISIDVISGRKLDPSTLAAGCIPGFGQLGNIFKAAKRLPKVGKAGGPGSGKRFPENVKDAARAESDNKCVFCGRPTTREPGPNQSNIDHAEARSRGGTNTFENAQNTCRTCNLDKADRSTTEFLRDRGNR
jgi:RHS repeat-associated protein